MTGADQIVRAQRDLFESICGPLDDQRRVLDLGCGNGAGVRGWLSLWAFLGIWRPAHRGLGWREIAAHFAERFESVRYAERQFLRHSSNMRGRWLSATGRIVPPVFWLYRTFWVRVILASKVDGPVERAAK